LTRDARRFHLSWFSDDLAAAERPECAPEGHQEGVKTELLADGEQYPATMPADIWSDDVAEINESLKQLHLPY